MAKKKTRRTRQPKTQRVPRTRASETWTEAAFWGFIRSNLRKMSQKWPPIRQVLNEVRRPYNGENKRQKWEYQCCECQKWKMRKEVEVDHKIPCGSLRSFEDISGFMERMLVETDGLCVKCKACHQEKTNADRNSSK